ncbi:MAG TPA: fumarylacetoacetate hydrolase family protein [Candidatus Krumholzibacteriaceae bacterium]|nr:fumarylacetoacetate hydrolase family protein [Candidatus Krumholzibacteriaceae bacterium]
MKLVRYRVKEEENYGIWLDNRVICLPCLARSLKEKFPQRIEEFIPGGKEWLEKAERLLKNAAESEVKRASVPLRNVTLLAPIVFPPKIVCLGLNYRDHIREQHAETPDEPIIFIKPHTTIIGPKENIIKPTFVKKLDYEAELAIVMGRKAKNVSVSEAKDYIFGFTILNDVSARDFQFKDRQWTRGKGFDTFAPIGPCITTANQLKDTTNLHIRTWVNKELRQNSSTKNMVFNIYEIVHHLSRVMTLEPCDIIATGTPKGVGFALKPQPKFLEQGDVVRIEIEGIGVLENTVLEANF